VLDFVCAVKKGGRWVLSRKMIKTVEEYKTNVRLAKVVSLGDVESQCNW
jgi:hypothetical protein